MRGMKATLGIVLKIAALHIENITVRSKCTEENITVRSKCTEMAKEKEAHAESLIVFLLLSKADMNGGENGSLMVTMSCIILKGIASFLLL